MPASYCVFGPELEAFTQKIFKAAGVESAEAGLVAKTLVEANLRGVHTHGVLRVAIYLERLRQGGTACNQKAVVLQETPTTALLDGQNGMGATISQQAVELAREKAAANNVGLVSVRMTNHYGIAAYWAQKLAQQDMIGFTCSNVEPLMPATGAKLPTVGTNPFAFVIPGNRYPPVCLDVACSVVAAGKMFDYQSRNQEMPPNWFLDKEGRPTTDPFQASMVQPFGGHKGYGLAVMVEAMTALLSGGNFGHEFGKQYGDVKNPNHTSAFFAAVKIDAFRDLDAVRNSVDAYIDYLHSMPTAPGVDSVLYPGELEEKNRARSLAEGIALPENVVEELGKIADSLSLPPEDRAFLYSAPVG